MPQDEYAGEESQNVEGEIDYHEGAATPLGSGGGIRIYGCMDREEAQAVKSRNQANKDEGNRAGV